MVEQATYLVTQAIAERSGLIDSRYRTTDGRFILNDRDLSRIRFTVDEYISGLEGVEMISEAEAQTLIKRNNYQMGVPASQEDLETNEGKEDEE